MASFDTMVDIDFMIMKWGREYSLSSQNSTLSVLRRVFDSHYKV